MKQAGIAANGVFALGILLASIAALGEPPKGIALDPTVSAWFHTLRNPATGAFCCDKSDGHILDDDAWRTNGNSYEVKIADKWVAVPPNAVLDRIDNPTGAAVVFYLPWNPSAILCFVRPAET